VPRQRVIASFPKRGGWRRERERQREKDRERERERERERKIERVECLGRVT
jgi:hypothetical protein